MNPVDENLIDQLRAELDALTADVSADAPRLAPLVPLTTASDLPDHRRVIVLAAALIAVIAGITGLVAVRRDGDRAVTDSSIDSVPIVTVAPHLGPGVASFTTLVAPTDSLPYPTSPTDPAACIAPTALPFAPTNLPAGWTTTSAVSKDSSVAVWQGSGGVIEVWNGIRSDLPAPAPGHIITVLGHDASIGTISDGYSVVFDLGPTACDRWALVAHPAISEELLQEVAQNLVPT
jgi:hypothetical protein